jgi:hypothetical protein
MSCLPSLGDEALKCQVCGGLHPGSFPNICLDLDHFLEEYFPAEYESRRKKLQSVNSQCNPEGSSSSKFFSQDQIRVTYIALYPHNVILCIKIAQKANHEICI